MRHQVTIKDIARHLNISIATVSRALRDLPDIHPETKKSVLDLANEWDYQPNVLATSLVKSRTKTLGVIVPDLGYYFFSTVVKGIEEAAIEAGYSVLITQTGESYERELTNVQNLSRGQVEGFIISLSRETTDFEHLKRLQRRGIPLVFFDRECEEIDASKVMVDNEQSAYEAVTHMISNGCKRIAFLAGSKNVTVSNQRRAGYLRALRDGNLPVEDSLLIYGDYHQSTATACTHQLMNLPIPPDGILAVSDRLAIGAVLALRERGVQIPQEVALVSFNDEPICSLMTPTISSVSQPTTEIGKIAANILISQIEYKGDSFPSQVKVLKTELKIRESSQRK